MCDYSVQSDGIMNGMWWMSMTSLTAVIMVVSVQLVVVTKSWTPLPVLLLGLGLFLYLLAFVTLNANGLGTALQPQVFGLFGSTLSTPMFYYCIVATIGLAIFFDFFFEAVRRIIFPNALDLAMYHEKRGLYH